MDNKIAQNIKKLRLDNNLSQKEFGQIFHVTNSTVSYWEKGEREVASETLIKIASYFNVTLDDLYGTTALISNDYQAIYRSVKVYDFSSEAKNYHLYIRISYVVLTVLLNLIFVEKNIFILTLFILASFILLGYDLFTLLITPEKKINTYNVRLNKTVTYESSFSPKKKKTHNSYILVESLWTILLVWTSYPFVYLIFFAASNDETIITHIGFLIFSTTIMLLYLVITELRTKEYKSITTPQNSHFRFNYIPNKLAWIFQSLIFNYVFMFISFYGKSYFEHDLLIWIVFAFIPTIYLFGYLRYFTKLKYYDSLKIKVE